MVPAIVILTMVVFVLVDLLLRLYLKRREKAKLRRQREEALDIGLRLEWSDEANSLKRVEVEDPRARILAVDDEPVVLDSFRRILVLEGFAVDTVETGEEALGLVRTNDYDFVFTDLKMPGMDGLDVTKAVKHLRPDIDVVLITGYATIESAVETMKCGAMDYVEKPFTADELAAFANKLLFIRQERLAKSEPPQVRLVTPTNGESASPRVINVPGGAFVTPEHTWVAVEMNGEARIGIDDLAQKTLSGIDGIGFPESGRKVVRGGLLFSLHRSTGTLEFSSPLTGTVSQVNHELAYRLDLVERSPVTSSWICRLVPENLSEELRELRIGVEATSWYEGELARLNAAVAQRLPVREATGPVVRASQTVPEKVSPEQISARWEAFGGCFLRNRKEKVPA